MGYVIAAIILLLIVAAAVTMFVLDATRRQRQASAADSDYGGTPGSEAAIVAPDDNTPLGDTDQHSGEQTSDGRTIAGREGDERPSRGTGQVGEAEGSRRVTPESEKLANRPR